MKLKNATFETESDSRTDNPVVIGACAIFSAYFLQVWAIEIRSDGPTEL